MVSCVLGFAHRMQARPLAGRAAWAVLARAATGGAQLAGLALVGRLAGVAELAVYITGSAALTLVGLAADAGSATWVARSDAAAATRHIAWPGRLALLSVASIGVLLAASVNLISQPLLPAVLAGGALFSVQLHERGRLWALERFRLDAVVAAMEACVVVASIALLIDASASPLWAFAVAYGFGAVARWRAARRASSRTTVVPVSRYLSELRPYLGHSWMVAATSGADLLILAAFTATGSTEVAVYGVVLRVYYASLLPFEALGLASMPGVAKGDVQLRALSRLWRRGAVVVLCLFLFGAGVAYVFLLPKGTPGYWPVVLTLLVGLPLRSGSFLFGAAATGLGHQESRFRASALALIVMLALDAALIPVLGARGAATALVVAEAVLVVGYRRASRLPRRTEP